MTMRCCAWLFQRKLLVFVKGVYCGVFRTGEFVVSGSDDGTALVFLLN